MKLWEKGFALSESIEKFTAGQDKMLDLQLAPYDIQGTMAHVKMLYSIGLLSKEELMKIAAQLSIMYESALDGSFFIEDQVEDVHSHVEIMLSDLLGDVGKRIHAGRSRNDQILVDLKLFYRDSLLKIVSKVELLASRLIQLSEKNKAIFMPGYTHSQVAMPSSFGLWFASFAEGLVDDLDMVEVALKMSNRNPLGSAAGYGSSLPLNRTMTTKLLGFSDLHHNVVYAQMSRPKTDKLVAEAIASIAFTVGRLSADVCLYSGQDFNFFRLSDDYTTGSSIMPHKKNPDVFELLRARSNQLQAVPGQVTLLSANLSTGYHRDYQVLKEIIFPSIHLVNAMLDIATEVLPKLNVSDDILKSDKYHYVFSVDAVNALLPDVPFREAYRKVADDIRDGTYRSNPSTNYVHEGSTGNLHNEFISNALENKLKQIDDVYVKPMNEALANLFVVLPV